MSETGRASVSRSRSRSRSASNSRTNKRRSSTSPDTNAAATAAAAPTTSSSSSAPITVSGRLYVSHLSDVVDNSELRRAFDKFGTVTEAFVLKDSRTGRSKQTGFVQFANPSDAVTALAAMDEQLLHDARITVKHTQQLSGEKEARIDDRLYVANLKKGTTRDELQEIFGKFGTVTDVLLCTSRETREFLGSAFIQYAKASDAADAQKSLSTSGVEFTVNFARRQRSRDSRSFRSDRDDRRPDRFDDRRRGRYEDDAPLLRMVPPHMAAYPPPSMRGAPPPSYYPPSVGYASLYDARPRDRRDAAPYGYPPAAMYAANPYMAYNAAYAQQMTRKPNYGGRRSRSRSRSDSRSRRTKRKASRSSSASRSKSRSRSRSRDRSNKRR